jgi:hypothetical protein
MKKPICEKTMSFDECELAILRSATDKAEKELAKEKVNTPDVKRLIKIIETFLKRKKLIVYGGTAINAILPREDQFYDREYELPDYDFFSTHPLEDTKELCDIYLKEGFLEVEGKSGVHEGTYKVFVNFIPVADITYLHRDIYSAVKREAISVAGIYYCPPNYLRMSMYLELSRPAGDISRWEKVLKRLTLLNKHYPLSASGCDKVEFQRQMSVHNQDHLIYETVKEALIDQGVIFFGGYAMRLYSHYMPHEIHKKFQDNPDFDVLSEEPETTAIVVKERLGDVGIKNIRIVKKPAIGEIVAPHYEICIGKDAVAFVYEPIACHSFNVLKIEGRTVKIASIDTMLSFYLAFLYAARAYYDPQRILCMSQYLFKVQQENRLRQTGLLKRFSTECYGHQQTLEEIRAHKSEKFAQLKDQKGTRQFEEVFFRYRPADKGGQDSNPAIRENIDKKEVVTKRANKKRRLDEKKKSTMKTKNNKKKKNHQTYKRRSMKSKWYFNITGAKGHNKKRQSHRKSKVRGRGGLFI